MRFEKNILFGVHPVNEAILAGRTIDKVLLRQGFRNDILPGLMGLLKENKIPFQFVPPEKLNSITSGNHQGIIAYISAIEYTNLDMLIPSLYEQGKLPAFAILDGITDVRNIGAIARSAICAGVDALIVPSKGSAQINADAVKTSAGALNTLPVCRVESLYDTVKYLKSSGFSIIASIEKADRLIYQMDFNSPLAIILGAEDTGIDNRLLNLTDHRARIPLTGAIQSLNVSAAAAVVFFEMARQRMTVP